MAKLKSTTDQVGAFYGPLRDSQSAARRVGWSSEGVHELRLRALLGSVGPLAHFGRVLDVGCGEGRLLELLGDSGFQGGYRGEDILPYMVEAALHQHPEGDFAVMNSFDSEGPEADLVCCSGSLNTLAVHESEEAFAKALTCLWARTRETLVLDFAVADRHRPGAMLATFSVEQALRVARDLTPSVRLLEDLIPGEAILVMSRSRCDRLALLGGDDDLALVRAELLLSARDPQGVRSSLAGWKSTKAMMLRALADVQSGRLRDGERALRDLAVADDEAKFHWAILLDATRRGSEAKGLLEEVRLGDGPLSDDARLHLMGPSFAPEPHRLKELHDGIRDPWIKREAEGLLETPD